MLQWSTGGECRSVIKQSSSSEQKMRTICMPGRFFVCVGSVGERNTAIQNTDSHRFSFSHLSHGAYLSQATSKIRLPLSIAARIITEVLLKNIGRHCHRQPTY